MTIGKFIAYYRVSTARQGQSGLGLEAQRKAVDDYLNGGDWKLVEEFTEVESGKRNDRPKLDAALAACRKHRATLVVAKLDRLSRNAAFLLLLRDSKVDFKCADMPEADRFTVGILALVAEREAEMTSKRTRDALAAAKARGVKLGNPRKRSRTVGGEKRVGWDDALRKGRETITDKADQFAANVIDVLPNLSSFISKACSGYGPVWTGLQTHSA